jgi:hypothetical protein
MTSRTILYDHSRGIPEGAEGAAMAAGTTRWRTDCRFFEGDRPCIHKRECPGCPLFEPAGRRILLLKLGALGDVLRTTPLLPHSAAATSRSTSRGSWVLDARPSWKAIRASTACRSGLGCVGAAVGRAFDVILSPDKDPYSTAPRPAWLPASGVASSRRDGADPAASRDVVCVRTGPLGSAWVLREPAHVPGHHVRDPEYVARPRVRRPAARGQRDLGRRARARSRAGGTVVG